MESPVISNFIRPQRLLHEGLLASANRHPNKIAIIIEDRSYTYSELLDASLRLANAFTKRGVSRGDRIAIYMDNTWSCVVSIYAVLFAGGVFLLINPQTKSHKLKYILTDSDSIMLLTNSHLESTYLPALESHTCITEVISSGAISQSCTKDNIPISDFNEILNNTKPLNAPVIVIPNDLAALIYTSGSTGFPKGVMHSHQTMVFAAWSLIEYLRLSENDRIMLVLPLSFDYGLYQLLMTIKLGATLVIERSFTFPAKVYQRITEREITVFPAVPTTTFTLTAR